MAKNPLVKREAERTQNPSAEFLAVLKRWLAMFGEHYRQPLSPLSVLVYRENLCDLSPEQLDYACREALKTSEFMPTVALIRQCAENRPLPDQFLGPRFEWSEELEAERKKREAEFKRSLEENKQAAPEGPTIVKQNPLVRPQKSAQQQMEELKERGWLH